MLTSPRIVTENPRLAGRWVEEAGQQLQRGCLAGAIRSKEADNLSFSDLEGNTIDGADNVVASSDETLEGPEQPGSLAMHGKVLGQVSNPNRRRAA